MCGPRKERLHRAAARVGKAKVKNVHEADARPLRQGQGRAEAKLAEFRVSADALIDVGDELTVEHFVPASSSTSPALHRQGFSPGDEAAQLRRSAAIHGVSIAPSHGSTGQCQDPGKVFKGKKMAGHMGDRA
jgi:large subunit ribosomal protein L3